MPRTKKNFLIRYLLPFFNPNISSKYISSCQLVTMRLM